MKMRILILDCLVLACVVNAGAGDRSNPRAMGMARTVNATARQFDAVGINPALLGVPPRQLMSVGIARVGVGISADFLSYDVYNDYFTGTLDGNGDVVPTYLTPADKERILSGFPGDIGTVMADGEGGLIGASLYIEGLGGLGFSATEHFGGKAMVPRDYARFMLYGLDSLGSTYDLDGAGLGGWWWREYNVSFGTRIPVRGGSLRRLYAGIGLKLVHGFGVAETVTSTGLLANEKTGMNQYVALVELDYRVRRAGTTFFSDEQADFNFFPEPAGTGFGLDLGMAADWNGVLVTMSVTDIGSIDWTGNLSESFATYSGKITDPFSEATQDSIRDALKGETGPGTPFSTTLPTKLRIGFAFLSDSVRVLSALPKRLLLAFDYTQGFTSTLNNTTSPRFSLGIEYRPISFLPLRTGISVGGGTNVRWAAGFGLDFIYASLDLGMENVLPLFDPSGYDMLSVGAGLTFRL
jgi:hypothetical protein